MTDPTATYRSWTRLHRHRLGRAAFSLALAVRAPYFATILPTVTIMEPGHSEAEAPLWPGVHNHLHTFHAIAACNLAEVAMGMLNEATVPTSHRWIPKAMSVQYLAKAKTRLRAVARLDPLPDFAAITEGVDVVVPVSIYDTHDVEVVHADITTWITPKMK